MGEKSKKVQVSRLTWYWHVLSKEEEYIGKKVMVMGVPGKRRRGRPKRKQLDNIKDAPHSHTHSTLVTTHFTA